MKQKANLQNKRFHGPFRWIMGFDVLELEDAGFFLFFLNRIHSPLPLNLNFWGWWLVTKIDHLFLYKILKIFRTASQPYSLQDGINSMTNIFKGDSSDRQWQYFPEYCFLISPHFFLNHLYFCGVYLDQNFSQQS